MSFLDFYKARLQNNVGKRYEKRKNQDKKTKIFLLVISVISVIFLIIYKTLFFVILSVLLWGLFFLLKKANEALKRQSEEQLKKLEKLKDQK
ncbi:hypothetical protein LJR015_002602 [Peribacillus frigoritolerans]|uniref:hypothetical protein n=1 Tax=Peribacillus frigoritolerans TaxID=450367 RepID=UPI003ECD76A2